MIRINDFASKATLKAAALVSVLLLFAAVTGFGQQTVNLIAAPTTATLPDGTIVPMWGYFCATAVSGSTATCAAANPNSVTAPPAWAAATLYSQGQVILDSNGNVQIVTTGGTSGAAPPTWHTSGTTPDGTGTLVWTFRSSLATYLATTATWSPVVITVPTGQGLTINLTNDLSFTTTGTANTVPTSIVIIGQVGGGLGNSPTSTPSPTHTNAQGCPTWFIAAGNTPPGTPCTSPTPNMTTGTPPSQGPRVQSMATEVSAGTTSSLTWAALKPGTFLLESGTHPSIQVPMGLIGTLVVTTAPSGSAAGIAYPGVACTPVPPATTCSNSVPAVQYNAEAPVEFSEIDPVQNKEVDQAVRTAGFSETNVWTRMNTGSITALTLTSPGSGYTTAPAVTIAGGGGGGATASATVGFGVASVTVTNGGSGYATAPAVSFGGNGDATATATLSYAVASASVTSGGSGYAVGDTISLTGGGGTGAVATVATITGTPTGPIATVSVTGGSGYTSAPTVDTTLTGSGSGAVLAATLATTGSVASVIVGNAGAYAIAPTVQFNGGGGTGAAATAALSTTSSLILTLTNAGGGYTTAPTVTIAPPGGTGGTAATATATVGTGGCGVANTCYPPAVNYTPFYYLINGVAFNKTAAGVSVFPATAGTTTTGGVTSPVLTGITGTVLVRIVNAGLRLHVPSIVNSLTQGFNGAGAAATVGGFTLIAEDGNPLPEVQVAGATITPAAPRVQTDVLMVPSKVYDALVNAPQPASLGAVVPALPIYDRELSLSGNSSVRDAGMLAYISVNNPSTMLGASLPAMGAGALFAAAQANPDTYNGLVCPGGTSCTQAQPFTVSDPAKGVIANDVNVYGATLLSPPTSGTITCGAMSSVLSETVSGMCANGTFTYTPNTGSAATSDSFTYCANNGINTTTTPPTCPTLLTAMVTLGPSNLTGGPIVNNITYTARISNFLKIPSAGVLEVDSDQNNLPLQVVVSSVTPSSGLTVNMDPNGGFTALLAGTTPATGTTASFTYVAQNSQGTKSSPATVTINFPGPSNLVVKVVDAQAFNSCQGDSTCISGLTQITDYRWIIEEDRTFWVDPNCTVNDSGPNTGTGTYTPPPGCPGVVPGPPGQTTVPTFGVNFHASSMPYVAQGCTGPLSCEGGQTMLDTRLTITIGTGAALTPVLTTGSVSSVTVTSAGTGYSAGDIVTFSAAPTGGTTATGSVGTVNPAGGIVAVTITNPGAGYTAAPTASVSNTNPTLGQHIPAVCDLGNGACRPDPNCTALPCLSAGGSQAVMPGAVHLDPAKRYYISVLPGDAGNPFPANANPPDCSLGPILTASDGTQSLNTKCGHTMSGTPIPAACNLYPGATNPCSTASTFSPVTVLSLPTPLPTGKLSVMVFEDDFPLNGEQDAGGGIDTVSPNEPGLGEFNIVLWDTYGGLGDVTGQDSFDAFNQPLSNSLAGTIDPATGFDACPISANPLTGPAGAGNAPNSPQAGGMAGMIVTCPKYESDGQTLSPLAGQAVVANLMQDKFSVQAYPGANRIARGEQWVQTNTLDGQHPHDSFIRLGEPSYFQEYGPAGYHVTIGFANPAIINARAAGVCSGTYGAVGPCTNTIDGQVDVQRQSRTPDQRLYPSRSRDALAWTQCWVSLGDPDAEDFMFTFCDANGNFSFNNVPGGNWRLTIGDQWNDQIIDGLSTPANVGCIPTGTATTCTGGITTLHLGNIGVQQWQANLYTTTYIDDNHNGIKDPGEIGIPFLYNMIHYRDGHNSNALVTDFNGVANFNETFPLFNWYVVMADDSSTSTRYKTTGIHTVYDAGGPADGTSDCGAGGARPCGTSNGYTHLANTNEQVPLPGDLSVPGAVYCSTADCSAEAASFQAGTAIPSTGTAGLSTGRIDPPWVTSEGWSGETSQGNWIEFGKAPFAPCPPACVVLGTAPNTTTTTWGENGGIRGGVDYAATRPFDSASFMIQQPWEPYVPEVTINLYQEGVASDGVTPTLKMVDTTLTTSWDDWAQGFYPNTSTTATPNNTAGTGTGAGIKPYMSCPGQGLATGTNADLFFFTLNDQPDYLDYYNSIHNGGTLHTLPYNAQYKCYDAMHIWNQIQPAVMDGRYSFPSSLGIDPITGKPVTTMGSTNGVTSSLPGTNCTICVHNPTTATVSGTDFSAYDPYRSGTPMLPPGKYVVEVVLPPGFEIYKEEDKNLLIGDNYIAPVTQQFGGLGADIFIIPDQASVASLYDQTAAGYNPNNFQNQTTQFGLAEELSGVPGFPGFQNPLWPCVGEKRVVPDFLSLFPQAMEVAPFAGATRPLCDRKEVTLVNQMTVLAQFAVYTSTHIASKFTGVITDDFTSEFDPFAPQFGEKFAPPNLPISTKDYLGNELSRVYSDNFGLYDGLTFSSWEVNPPNITGYSPSMLVQCMNDPGPIPNGAGSFVNDPLYQSAYSNFCYEEPYMPGLTTYLDTPVVPTQAFVGAAYNNADCAYPDATPAIAEVDGDGIGPWVAAGGHTLTITALGNQQADNSAYSGPSASVSPFNLKKLGRHYGFGPAPAGGCSGGVATAACPNVTVGGVPLHGVTWTDATITGTIQATGTGTAAGVPLCTIQQQAQYSGSAPPAQCGQLLITAANGKQSIDTVTVTIGGKQPDHVPAKDTIQSHIDKAAPGDLIIVDPTCTTTAGPVACTPTGVTKSAAAHTEMLIMWKPVRLQGVGAATTIINANTHPAGKLLDPWRRHINCLFGLTLQGVPYGNSTPYDSPTNTVNNGKPYACPDTGWQNFSATGQVVATTIAAINVTSGGSGYTTIPNVTISAPNVTGGTPATAMAVIDTTTGSPTFGRVTAINVTNPGSGYEFPTVTIAAPPVGTGNTTATAVAVLTAVGGSLISGSSPQVDRLPLEATIGWDATLNGNLAEQLQEPSLMGAYEGAAITVLAKGMDFHGANPWNDGTENGAFPAGTTLISGVVSNPGGAPGTPGALTVGDANQFCGNGGTNPFPSNFICNPSSIDGLGITNSSQGGGGIFVHGWAHFIQIANNRVYNNAGTLSGGISVGQGEFAGPYIQGGATNAPPGSCSDGTGLVTNQHQPDCFQLQPNVHNNMITQNSSLGDELFSATLSGGGGVSFCTGNDYYKFNYNWVCGNISTGEGGGLVHLGEIYNGDIEHNSIVFNQSSNPTIPTNGGGIEVMGTPDTDPTCPGVPDSDCPPGLSDGTGPGLVINANLIQGNSADSGSGGGIRLQHVNGTEVGTFFSQPQYWHDVTVTNNIIVNNMAGWDGAGISLQDALNVQIINNTIAHNDTLASSGVLTTSIGTPQASSPAGNCTQPTNGVGDTASCPQSAGVTSTLHSSVLDQGISGLTLTCPTGQPHCEAFSNPLLANNVIWQNRSFYIGITGQGQGNQNQQNLVGLFSAGTGAAAPNQTATGSCDAGVSYWDLGVRGDQWPTGTGAPITNPSGLTLNPTYSVLTNTTGYDPSNSSGAPPVVAQYCNGSRVPPECTAADGCGGPHGFGTPPGIADALTPNPVFSLTPSATVDEGNNWINVSWGPLAMVCDSSSCGTVATGATLANYNLTAAIDNVPIGQPHPVTDFFGNARPEPGRDLTFDAGAIEFNSSVGTFGLSLTPASWSPSVTLGCGSFCTLQTFLVTNTGTVEVGISPATITGSTNFVFPSTAFTCGYFPFTALAPGDSCTINVAFGSSLTDTLGSKVATLSISSQAGTTATAALNGTVGAAPRTLTPSSATFPSTGLGFQSAAQTFTLSNPTGNPTLTVGFSLSGPNANYFNRSGGSCGTTLAAGATCTINVRFGPPTAAAGGTTGAKTATLNAGGLTSALSGTAVLPRTLTPASLTFPTTARGSVSAAQALTLSNPTGNPTLTVGFSLTGPNANYFNRPAGTAGGTCGTSLLAGATCTINLTFAPPSAAAGGTIGSKSATAHAGGLTSALSGTAN